MLNIVLPSTDCSKATSAVVTKEVAFITILFYSFVFFISARGSELCPLHWLSGRVHRSQ